MVKKIVINIYLIIVFIMFSIPLIQMKFNLLPEIKLNGVQKTQPYPSLNFKSWLNGEFESKFNTWFNQNFGLREYLIKTNNQISYNVFNDSGPTGESIIKGKDSQLYSLPYVESYIQVNPPLKVENLEIAVKKIKELQDLLKKRGVSFLVLITPSKASIYPEFLPERYLSISKNEKNKNYKNFTKLLLKYSVNTVDGHQITVEKKGKTQYPLFPRGGLHWNELGAYYTFECIINTFEELILKEVSHVKLNNVNADYKPFGSDRDLIDLLNLWFPDDHYISPHLSLSSNDADNKFKPKVLIEGGSFNYPILWFLSSNNICSELIFISYYNWKVTYPDPTLTHVEIKQIDWDKEIFNKDIIILEVNELYITDNMDNLGNGFVKDALVKLKGLNEPTKY